MKTIIIIAILLTSGVVYAVTLEPKPISELVFDKADIGFVTENTKWATTTEEEVEIRTGIRIPVTYDFPVASSSGFVIEQVEENIGMNLDSYDRCRSSKTQEVCKQELDDDIAQTVDAFRQNKEKELEELKRKSFQDELSF